MGKPTRTYDERLAEERKKLEQARNRIRDLERRQKVAERKERTKRLIAIGAEVEHFAGCEITDLNSFKDYLKQFGYAIANTQKGKTSSSAVTSADVATSTVKTNASVPKVSTSKTVSATTNPADVKTPSPTPQANGVKATLETSGNNGFKSF